MGNHNVKGQNHYEKLFNLSPDMLSVIDRNYCFVKVNPAFANLLGFSEEDLVSKSFYDFVHPDDIDATEKQAELQSRELTEVVNFENRYRTLNGDFRTLSWSANIDAETGDFYCIARDVTHEKFYQKQLTQIYDVLNNHVIVSKTDAQGDITEVNKKFCDISGYSQDELLGNNHRIINSGNHSKWFFKHMWETISSGNVWSGRIENRAKDGSHYFVKTIITPIYGQHGHITHYLSIRFDITEVITNKKELAKTNRKLSEMSKIAQVGGWELDIKTGELNWTDETFRILEVDKKESDQPILPEGLALFVDEHKPIIDNAVTQAIEFGTPYSLELQALTAKGNKLWVYTNGKANFEKGKIVSLSGTIQDIDLRKTAELKLEQETIKTVHTAKMASLGELSAGIAHEINNPLAIIGGAVEVLPKIQSNPEKVSHYLHHITKSCARISRIVNSLKKFARASDERLFELLPLKNIVEESIILTETKAKRHSVNITLNIIEDSGIWCDEIEIEQVLVNLINNAIDAIKTLPRTLG